MISLLWVPPHSRPVFTPIRFTASQQRSPSSPSSSVRPSPPLSASYRTHDRTRTTTACSPRSLALELFRSTCWKLWVSDALFIPPSLSPLFCPSRMLPASAIPIRICNVVIVLVDSGKVRDHLPNVEASSSVILQLPSILRQNSLRSLDCSCSK